MPKPLTGKMMPCETCGVEFYVPKHRIGITKYCSRKCQAIGSTGKTRQPKNTALATARENGDIFYFPGLECQHGHVAKRYVSCNRCYECAQNTALEIKRKNAERKAARPLSPRQIAKLNGDLHYFSGTPCKRGHDAPRFTNSGSCVVCARDRIRVAYQSNAELRDRQANYRKDNAERYRTHVRNRRATIKGLEGTHSPQDIEELWTEQTGRCAYCKNILVNGFHVDHIVATSKGGRNDKSNLQLTCQTCNLRKWSKDHEEFLKQIAISG